MTSASFSMSGIVTLNHRQVEFLTILGLGEVPSSLTLAQLQELLAKADAAAAEMGKTSADSDSSMSSMLEDMTRQTIAEIRMEFGLKNPA